MHGVKVSTSYISVGKNYNSNYRLYKRTTHTYISFFPTDSVGITDYIQFDHNCYGMYTVYIRQHCDIFLYNRNSYHATY